MRVSVMRACEGFHVDAKTMSRWLERAKIKSPIARTLGCFEIAILSRRARGSKPNSSQVLQARCTLSVKRQRNGATSASLVAKTPRFRHGCSGDMKKPPGFHGGVWSRGWRTGVGQPFQSPADSAGLSRGWIRLSLLPGREHMAGTAASRLDRAEAQRAVAA